MNSTLKTRLPLFPVILLSLLIAAVGVGCGGGGGGTPTPPPNPNQDAQGLYTTNGDGSAVLKNANPLNPNDTKPLTDIKGMVYGDLPNQDFIFFDIDANVLYQGTITSITLTDFVGTATVYNDGVMVEENVAVSGTVTTRSQMDMTLTGSGDFVSGSIKGLFSAAYDNVATNARIRSFAVKPWESPIAGSVKMEIAGMKTSDVEIDVPDTTTSGTYKYSSRISGSAIVCEHSGSLTSGAPKNIYPLNGEKITNLSINCALENSPVYSGFASVVTVDAAGLGTEMWYAVTNGTNSTFMLLTKQN